MLHGLQPYQFTQNVSTLTGIVNGILNSPQIPSDVDVRVMLTFLELYQTLLGFVFFKLYTDAGPVYPPPLRTKPQLVLVLSARSRPLNSTFQTPGSLLSRRCLLRTSSRQPRSSRLRHQATIRQKFWRRGTRARRPRRILPRNLPNPMLEKTLKSRKMDRDLDRPCWLGTSRKRLS
jgi:hypothetical protein